jgi:hypothetical protein
MTVWNTGYFLVVKKWWMGVTILFVTGFALWGFVDFVRRCYPSLAPWYRRFCSWRCFRGYSPT